MKLILVTLVGLALVSEFTWARSNSLEWSSFKRQFNKSYGSQEEEARRFANFMATKAMVEAHNADTNKSYELGINHMADWHADEKATLSGYRQDPNRVVSELSADAQAFLDGIIGGRYVPTEFDWRNVPGHVSSVKDQGMCGSCWAFATTGVLEGQQLTENITEKLIPLSEQNLVDCSKRNYGCRGGIMATAYLDIAKLGGIDSEEVYPYTGDGDSRCYFREEKSVMKVDGYFELIENDEKVLKDVVYQYGPVPVAIYSTPLFHHYKRGVFKDNTCPPGKLNHAVLIVGYGTDAKEGDYWIVKNSWGQDWGEAGYIRMERGTNICGIASVVTVPKIR